MGCDIHCFAEMKKNGTWRLVEDKVFPNQPERFEKIKKKLEDLKAKKNPTKEDLEGIQWAESYDEFTNIPYNSRNYDTFAILANVRNGLGFAGCDTGNGFNTIAEPKGLPEDASDFVKAESDRWDGDGHSHTWLTVKEILNFDWKQVNTKRGVVSLGEYEDWIKSGRNAPHSYCGGVAGRSVISLSEEEYLKFKGADQLDSEKEYYLRIQWQQSYESAARYFLENTVPSLQKLGSPEDVRLVFWFDN